MYRAIQPELQTFEAPVSADGLRVALFSGNYNCVRDGANKALNRLVAHLLDREAAVRVYSPTSSRPPFEPVGDLVSVPSVPIPGRREFRVALGLPRPIERDVRDFAPNIFHLSAPDWLGTAAQRLGRSMGLPVVASMHTRFETYFEYYRLGFLRAWAVNRQRAFYCESDRVLVPNEASRTQLMAMGIPADLMDIWSRAVEHKLFTPARRDTEWRRALGYADDEPILLFFGRVVREKGTDLFVETVAELRRRGLHVRPLVVGEGPARKEMEARLGDAVFLGNLDGEELGRAIASADILLNPSVTEAFGNVNLEAMAAGLAVVCAKACSASGLIASGRNGFLTDANPNSFATTVAMLVEDDETRARIGKSATRTAQRFDWSDVLDPVIRTYRDLTRPLPPRDASQRAAAGRRSEQ